MRLTSNLRIVRLFNFVFVLTSWCVCVRQLYNSIDYCAHYLNSIAIMIMSILLIVMCSFHYILSIFFLHFLSSLSLFAFFSPSLHLVSFSIVKLLQTPTYYKYHFTSLFIAFTSIISLL